MTTITNLCVNPSMEVASTGWAGYDATIARSTGWAYSGTASLQATVSGPIARPAMPVLTLPTTTHTAGVWVYHEMGVSRTFYVFYNGSSGPHTTVPSGTPTRIQHTFTGKGSGDSPQIRLLNSVAEDIYYIDAAMIVAGDTLPDYFDGDSDNAAWTGTPHASTSVLTLPDTSRTLHPVLKIGTNHIGPMRVGERN